MKLTARVKNYIESQGYKNADEALEDEIIDVCEICDHAVEELYCDESVSCKACYQSEGFTYHENGLDKDI